MREYAKSWDVRKIQDLGYQVDPNFLTIFVRLREEKSR